MSAAGTKPPLTGKYHPNVIAPKLRKLFKAQEVVYYSKVLSHAGKPEGIERVRQYKVFDLKKNYYISHIMAIHKLKRLGEL